MSGYKLYLLQEQETGIDNKTGNGYKESGKVILCDPQGFIVGEYEYVSGGVSAKASNRGTDGYGYSLPNQEFHNFGNELPRNLALPFSKQVQPGQLEEFKFTDGGKDQLGVRFANSSFGYNNFVNEQSRVNILIHEATGKGTLGCVGIKSAFWKDFTEDYSKILIPELPTGIQTISRLEYSLIQVGITPEEKVHYKHPSLKDIENTDLALQTPPALDQNSTFKSGLENVPKPEKAGIAQSLA